MKSKKYIFKIGVFYLFLFLFLNISNSQIFKTQNRQTEKERISLPPTKNIVVESASTMVGKLSIVGTTWQVTIVQGTDNQFYLDHNQDQQPDPYGTPFLDYRNKLEDSKLLIYGHNSETVEAPFHFLEKYINPKYYQQYPYLRLQTSTEQLYQIVSIIITTDSKTHMQLQFTEKEWHHHLEWMMSHSLYKTGKSLKETMPILILQTCYYQPKDSYLLVIAQKIT